MVALISIVFLSLMEFDILAMKPMDWKDRVSRYTHPLAKLIPKIIRVPLRCVPAADNRPRKRRGALDSNTSPNPDSSEADLSPAT